MKCPKCGAENQTTKFCGECGNQLVFEEKTYTNNSKDKEKDLMEDYDSGDDYDPYKNLFIALIVSTVIAFFLSFTKIGLIVGFIGICIAAAYIYKTQDISLYVIICIVFLVIALMISVGSFNEKDSSKNTSSDKVTSVSEETDKSVDTSGSDKKKIKKIEQNISKGAYEEASKMISELGLSDNDPEKVRLQLDLLLAQGLNNDAAKIVFNYADSIDDKSLLADDKQFKRLDGIKDKLNGEEAERADKIINDVNIAKIESVSGHDWIEATCTEPKTCKLCGETEGTSLGHDWVEATCTEAKTCSRCGETEGEALGHESDKWKVVKKATCSEEGEEKGVCSVCGEEVTRPIPKKEHVEGNWKIDFEATDTTTGARSKYCKVCGEKITTESYWLTEEEKIEYYKKDCESVSYDNLIRYPEKYENTRIKLTCSIAEVETVDSWIFEDQYEGKMGGNIISIMDKRTVKEPKLRAGDTVTIYGVGAGYNTMFTYQKGVFTGLPKNVETEKIPCVDMVYVTIK